LLKEDSLKMSEFLKNKYFFNEKSPSYNLIPEKDDFLKGNVVVLPEFLKIRTLLKENPLKMSEFLRNKHFVKGKSPKNV
jgi:hypothetical protein